MKIALQSSKSPWSKEIAGDLAASALAFGEVMFRVSAKISKDDTDGL